MLIKNRYIFITLILSSTVAVAADLNNPSAGPADTLSYTLQDICNRLRSGKEGTQQNFTEPTSGPANDSTDCTLNDVMKTAPKKETANGAQPNDVTKDKKYWGLTDGNNWGIKTGSSTAVDTSSGNATANDIKEGKIAWVDGKNVVGTSTAVDTSSGDATANDIKEGKIAWVDGKKVVGTLKFSITCNGRMNGERWCDNEDGTITDMTTGLVWLQKAESNRYPDSGTTSTPPPSSSSNRYTDNGDGTVTDNRSGLIWLKNASCFGHKTWETAKQKVDQLASGQCDLRDDSKVGMWRLPTNEEWEAMVDKGYNNPSLSNAAGTGQWTEGDAFLNARMGNILYWSSGTTTNDVGLANLYFGSVSSGGNRSGRSYVWPVRSRK